MPMAARKMEEEGDSHQMNLRNCILMLLAVALPALAGPPLICHPIEIGAARSLPWRTDAQGWDATDRSYDAAAKLIPDTLALLGKDTPLPVRMETMRRASIYASRDVRLAQELAGKLDARANETQTSLALFDAGYWIETVRQASFIYRYDMLSPAEKPAWQIRKGLPGRDGLPMVKQAIAKEAVPGMEKALALIEEYRRADLAHASR